MVKNTSKSTRYNGHLKSRSRVYTHNTHYTFSFPEGAMPSYIGDSYNRSTLGFDPRSTGAAPVSLTKTTKR